MTHRLTFRLTTASAALAFAATGGVTGMEMHPLSAHPEPEAVLAMEMGLDAPPMAQMPAGGMMAHAGHHGHQHSMPGSSNECNCLGPCQGGGPPTLASHAAVLPLVPERGRLEVVYEPEALIQQDPTAYLVPLPNAPPSA